jgi:hypothetical protein
MQGGDAVVIGHSELLQIGAVLCRRGAENDFYEADRLAGIPTAIDADDRAIVTETIVAKSGFAYLSC